MKAIKQLKSTIMIILLSSPAFMSAQGFKLQNPLKGEGMDSIPGVLTAVLKYVLVPIATVLVTIMIVFYGMKLVMSQGKPEEVTKAKKMIFWALVGGFVILGASAITEVIANTTKEIGR